MSKKTGAVSVAIGSLGSVGRVVAGHVVNSMPYYSLSAVSAQRQERAYKYLESIGCSARVTGLADLSQCADVVVECAPAAMFRELAEPTIDSGKTLIVLSVGALLDSWDLVVKAEKTGAEILVPSGALLALDAVQAAAEGSIYSVEMVTRKPLAGLRGAPFVVRNNIDLSTIYEPLKLFSGTARQAIDGFPANLNVAVALSLAGIGPDKTSLEVWADPTVKRNTHTIDVDSDSAKLQFTIENIPSENPKTGRLTSLSVIAMLRKRASSLRIGT